MSEKNHMYLNLSSWFPISSQIICHASSDLTCGTDAHPLPGKLLLRRWGVKGLLGRIEEDLINTSPLFPPRVSEGSWIRKVSRDAVPMKHTQAHTEEQQLRTLLLWKYDPLKRSHTGNRLLLPSFAFTRHLHCKFSCTWRLLTGGQISSWAGSSCICVFFNISTSIKKKNYETKKLNASMQWTMCRWNNKGSYFKDDKHKQELQWVVLVTKNCLQKDRNCFIPMIHTVLFFWQRLLLLLILNC